MINIEVNQALARAQEHALSVLFTTNKETRKRIRKIIREELKDAVKRVKEDARYAMSEDPRDAYKAVKSMLYRKILGGNISILQGKKLETRDYKLINRKLDANPHQRGGNRRPRSYRTKALDTYYGASRSFILRFINSGTKTRYSGYGRNGKDMIEYHKFINSHGGMGHRGAIAARNWFANDAPHEMDLAAENLSAVIDEELEAIYNENIKV